MIAPPTMNIVPAVPSMYEPAIIAPAPTTTSATLCCAADRRGAFDRLETVAMLAGAR